MSPAQRPSRPRVVVTHWVHDDVAEFLARFSDPVIPARSEGVWPAGQVRRLAAGADALLACMADRLEDDFLADCPRLRVVSAALKGADNFDARACDRRGVWLTILPDMLTGPTAELTIGLLIGLLRSIAPADAQIRGGGYQGWRPVFLGTGLAGTAVGILGMGQLGQAVARRLAGFEARVSYHDHRPLPPEAEQRLGIRRQELSELLASARVVICLLPLTADTRHLVDAAALARMPRGSFLVNVGRGSVVDEEAVADALASGQLAGYAADVFEMEDWLLPGHPPVIPARLLRHPGTLFTPHLGSAVDDIRRQMSLAAARQIEQALAGQRPDYAIAGPA